MTSRQLELVALYASGYDYTEIAGMKFLSYGTVRRDLTIAKDTVGARSLTHLAVIALDFGLIRRNGNGYKPIIVEEEERTIT